MMESDFSNRNCHVENTQKKSSEAWTSGGKSLTSLIAKKGKRHGVFVESCVRFEHATKKDRSVQC